MPDDRIEFGDDWRDAWERAHHEMSIYDRAPSKHLIDQLVVFEPDERGWLLDRLGWLADTTHMQDGVPANSGRLVWTRPAIRHDTMEDVNVRIVLEDDGRQIVTAFPE